MFEFSFPKQEGSKLTVFIPGWGYDGNVFESWIDRLEDSSVMVIDRYSPFTFVEELAAQVKAFSPTSLTLIGFSMGGFLAVDYAEKYSVDQVVLWGVRQVYPKQELDFVRKQVMENPEIAWRSALRFHAGKFPESIRFLKELLPKMVFPGQENLLEGLTYLEDAKLTVERLKPLNGVVFLHGSEDALAPIEEVRNLVNYTRFELEIRACAPHLFRP